MEPLHADKLEPTRDYLQDITRVLGKLQQAFLEPESHGWQYGLEVGMRGITTQPFIVKGEVVRASLDLVRHKVRIGTVAWNIQEYTPPELLNNIKVWLESQEANVKLDDPVFQASRMYDSEQAAAYAEALWWIHDQFRFIADELPGGIVSPILLYPHHFDLALSWFPTSDERQLTVGWSTGDETIEESYIYCTNYPDAEIIKKFDLEHPIHWQATGFQGAVLTYTDLCKTKDPTEQIKKFSRLFTDVRRVLDQSTK